MTLGNHMAEILRQGLWASLTGGWYYEPAHSLFCNVLHLYLWLVLFLFPLLVGIIRISLAFIIAYITFILFLFLILKMIVSYLHKVFDTTEPIVVTKMKEPRKRLEELKKKNRDSRPAEGFYEMVEMRQMERRTEGRRASAPNTADTRTPSSLASVAVSSTNVSVEADVHTRRIPDFSLPHRGAATSGTRNDATAASAAYAPRLERKLSEPIISPYLLRRAEAGDEEEGLRGRAMLTASLSENLHRDNLPFFREEWLARPLQQTHSDSPVLRIEQITSQALEPRTLIEDVERDAARDDFDDHLNDLEPHLKALADYDEWENLSTGDQKLELEEKRGAPSISTIMEDEMCVPSTSACNEVSLLHDSTLNVNDLPSTSRAVHTDVKAEITRFLEDLIDKHPETLDAIESVRQKRRGQNNGATSSSSGSISEEERASGLPAIGALSDLALRDGTHVASGHEDTSQGAVHSFQDEDGNWWTYAFDEQGVGTAQALGSSRQLMELLCGRSGQNGGGNGSGSGGRPRPRPLHVIPEAGSSDDEERVERIERERRRAASTSSTDTLSYLPHAPSSVFYAPYGNRPRAHALRTSQLNAREGFSSLSARLRAAVRSHEERQPNPVVMQLLEAEDRAEGEVHTWAQNMQMRGPSSLERLMAGRMGEREHAILAARLRISDYSFAHSQMVDLLPNRRVSNAKKKYYYLMKLCPFVSSTVKIKMDRLSLAALFDRNRSLVSLVFDVFLAVAVSLLSCLVLTSGIYHDISLVLFSFVVAGAHFSLLKSVQPDASSPVHGFNWQVAYSRPGYLLLLSSLLVSIHSLISPDPQLVPWNWNMYRLEWVSREAVLLAVRDSVATLILCLPLIFTFGWMPQVSTLAHHVLEQVEMHVLGGTASFGAWGAAAQLGRSLLCLSLLSAASLLAAHTQHSTLFSLFAALLVALSFLQSRFSSNPHVWRMLLCSLCSPSPSPSNRLLCGAASPLRDEDGNAAPGDSADEDNTVSPIRRKRCIKEEGGALPSAVRAAARLRLRQDCLFALLLGVVTFALHCTSLFSATQPYFTMGIVVVTFIFGLLNHYIYIQFRTHTPWKLLAKPILRAAEFGLFETNKAATLMIFEKIHMWMLLIEKNILYPLTVLSALSDSSVGAVPYSALLLPLIGTRILRSSFSHPQLVYLPLGLSFLIAFIDLPAAPTTCFFSSQMPPSAVFPLVLYFLVVAYPKWLELQLKLHFVMAYIAPWQITWGSAFHAFAQPFSVPHSVLIALQTTMSSLLSAPLNPFLGSSFITASYVRPVKFWERDYNTERSDASNTKLASQIDRGPMLDDSNLNAVFYEHLTRSLQLSIAGDMAMGRWGSSVQPGDCFVLASFYLNCLVHIIEVGNGFITFQLRGLEFRGTYCHQREVEAISEDSADGAGCCCCSPGSLPGILSLNTAWSLRWLAWQVTAAKLIVDGYSITDNSAVNLLQVHELRRLLVTLYCRCIIFYCVTSEKIHDWIQNESIIAALEPIERNFRYVDLDHMFCSSNDEDFDIDHGGISRQSFSRLFHLWIQHCISRNPSLAKGDAATATAEENRVSALCFALCLLGRRLLGAASFNRHSNAAESFLYGLHALFRGDFRVTCIRDEWVFADVDLLKCVVAPAVRMALKLHQDHFAQSDDLDDPKSLFDLIQEHRTQLFISHEHDPSWRLAIMENTPSLLALRHMYDDGQDDYKIIMLNRMYLNMRVIKLNKECVRAFWAGQQQELIFLRNRNPERGSIQNARQVLRNMINSSADQPVGYPIYVSPLTTSYMETHPQMHEMVGRPLTLQGIGRVLSSAWDNVRSHFGMRGSSSLPTTGGSSCRPSKRVEEDIPMQVMEQSVVQMTAEGARVSLVRPCDGSAASSSQSSTESHALDALGLITSRSEMERRNMKSVEITDEEQVFRSLHEPLKATGEPLVQWPREYWRLNSFRNHVGLTPLLGLTGVVVHTWFPNHPNKAMRAHIGDKIYLVMLYEFPGAFIPIGEKGIRFLADNFGGVKEAELRDGILRKETLDKFKAAKVPPGTPPIDSR